jgi:formylglycine-generating enzyme required for sulfatase activity
MDHRLQELERAAAAGDSEASWQLVLERYRSGEWSAGGAEGEPYLESVQRAATLEGFTFLDVRHYECGGLGNGIALFAHELTGLEFCLIPGGVFLMGSSADEPKHQDDEGPVHAVAVPPFLFCSTQCTQAAWERVTGETPAHYEGPRRPVEQVSWDDAQSFGDRAGLRLPSEAEWEYACRAGSTSTYCFGDKVDELQHYAAHLNDSLEELGDVGTQAVGLKLPNAFGLFDAHGNVEEWCQDAWPERNSYEGAPVDGSASDLAGASKRVARGGGWTREAGYCRSAYRYRYSPGCRIYDLGFRPARSLP